MHRVELAEIGERLREQRVGVAVVERDVGRRPQDDEHAIAVDAELFEHVQVRLEVGEVVLLLEAGIPQKLRRPDAEVRKALDGDRVRHDHLRRGAHAEVVLQRGELVVVRRRAGDAEPPRSDGELVRTMRQREIEAARPRPFAQCAQTRGERACLAEPRTPTVAADNRRFEAVQLE